MLSHKNRIFLYDYYIFFIKKNKVKDFFSRKRVFFKKKIGEFFSQVTSFLGFLGIEHKPQWLP